MSATTASRTNIKKISDEELSEIYEVAFDHALMPDDKDVGEDAYCLDVSYANPDLQFTGERIIRQVVDAENGSVTHAGQGVQNNIRTVTILLPGCDNIERVAEALVDGGMEVVIFPPSKLSKWREPLRYRLTEPLGDEAKPCAVIVA